MKWTVTFETVTRDDTGRVVSSVIGEKATKKFNTKLPDYMDTYHRGCNNYVVAEITH